MVTTIPLPNDLFESAEELAQAMGVSTGELYVIAIREYLKAHKSHRLIKQINSVCDKVDTRIDPVIQSMQTYSISKEEW